MFDASKFCVDMFDGGLTFEQLFRIWLGVTEYLFRNETLLNEVINTAIEDNTFRSDDLEFTFAARVGFSFLHFISLLFGVLQRCAC